MEFLNQAIERVPGWLGGAAVWRVVAAFFIIVLVLVLRRFVAHFVLGRIKRLASRTKLRYDDDIIEAIQPSIAGLFIVLGVFLAVQLLRLPATPYDLQALTENALAVAAAVIVIYGIQRLCYVLADAIDAMATRSDPATRGQFRVVLRQLLSIATWTVGILVIVQNLGYSITSILAGLGIGGLAVALGAQETLSNFFGSISLLTDRPFRVGDWIQVGDTIDGDVEEIGFRSTKVRAWDKSLVSIPNRDLASKVIKNWSRMPKRRVKQVIGVTYDATPTQMDDLVSGIEKVLRSDPAVDQDFILVKFTDFGTSSLDLLVYYFTVDTGWLNHLENRQNINLKIMQCVYDLGLSFAFPTQTIHLQRDD